MFKDVIKLITEGTATVDSIGQQTPAITKTTVYARKKPVPRSEFFAAGQTDIKPAYLFVIRDVNYSGQKYLEYDNKTYTIYRVYPTTSEMIELYCELRLG